MRLHATRAAVEEGIVPGGGVAYIRAQKALEKMEGANADETTGIAIVRRALEEPLRQIVANAGIEGSIVVQKVRDGKADYGFNARTEVYENLYAAGVIDPTKVTRVGPGERRFDRQHAAHHRVRDQRGGGEEGPRRNARRHGRRDGHDVIRTN
jgi:hypothetical protein